MAKNGWCTHPKRQHTSDVKILVRAGELACRNSWGGDLFQSRNEDDQILSPAPAADLPASPQESPADRDDEVTSVITPPDRIGSPSHLEEDRVVSDRPAPLRDEDDDPYNDAARQDQDERARIIARGTHDALMRARERHSQRRRRSGGRNDADDDVDDRVTTRQIRFSDRLQSSSPSQIQYVRQDPVPRAEIERRWQAPVDRFDSVPEVDPSFDLPAWRDSDDSRDTEDRQTQERDERRASEPVDIAPVSTYEHVLQRARRVREGKLHKAARPVRHARRQPHAGSRTEERSAAPPVEPSIRPQNGTLVDERDSSRPPVQSYQAEARDEEPEDFQDEYIENEWQADAIDDVIETADADLPDEDTFYDDSLTEPAPEDSAAHEWGFGRRRRSGGWLSHFGLGRGRQSETFDDAMVTRHAEAVDDDDYWEEDLAGELHETESDIGREDVDAYHADDGVEQHDVPWQAAYVDDRRPGRSAAGRSQVSSFGVAYDNIDDDSSSLSYLDEDEPGAPSPSQVPARHAAGRRSETWHRERLAPELPDLDDNLFEETFERRPTPSPAASLDRAPTGARSTAAIARDSYFRAARFREWQEAHAWDRATGPEHGAAEQDLQDPYEEGTLPDLEDPQFDIRDIVARGSELLDMTIDIAPDVPRECRTCRSFRSADGGARGWCTNEWAFTHRRMVNEDDLACETTIGCWWLPADRYWLIEEEDGYAVPTPRMDELIARRAGSQERKLSGTGA